MAVNLAPTERVSLGDPYLTVTGQWVIDNGVASWVGPDAPTPAPDAALIQLVVDTFASYVEPVPPVTYSQRKINRATAKKARGKTLTTEEEAALDYAETL